MNAAPTPTRSGWCTLQNTSTSASRSGIQGTRPSGSMLNASASSSAEPDEQRVRRQQQRLPAAHDHGAPALALACLGAGAAWRGARPLGAGRGRRLGTAAQRLEHHHVAGAVDQRGRGPGMRAKPESAGAPPSPPSPPGAGRIDAVDAAGGEQVAGLHVGVGGHEAQLQRRCRGAGVAEAPRCAAGAGVQHRDGLVVDRSPASPR